MLVGLSEGLIVGDTEGRWVGLGASVGFVVGKKEGESEGIIEGWNELEGAKLMEGRKEGCMERDGFIDGATDGILLGMGDSDGE
jgi:hypothetical protein